MVRPYLDSYLIAVFTVWMVHMPFVLSIRLWLVRMRVAIGMAVIRMASQGICYRLARGESVELLLKPGLLTCNLVLVDNAFAGGFIER